MELGKRLPRDRRLLTPSFHTDLVPVPLPRNRLQTVSQTPSPTSTAGLPFLRWGVLTALLLAQVLYLTLRFDSATLASHGGWWTPLIEHVGIVPQLLIVAVTATL